MAKANVEATAERVDHLQGMILAGEPNTACLTYARQTWRVSRLSIRSYAGVKPKGSTGGLWMMAPSPPNHKIGQEEQEMSGFRHPKP